VVIEHGLDALLPLAALVDQGVAQAHLGPQVEQVLGRNPRLGQAPDHQQLAQVARIGTVSLGALFVAASRRGLGRLGEMDIGTDRMQLLGHEPPARRRLQRHLEALAGEAPEEPAHVAAQRGGHARPAELARLGIDPLGRDLRTVLVESHYDHHHGGLLKLHK
jgi:hypothetical protein